MLSQFLEGQLPEERFQWGYLDRLAKEALWRDDETFALLNSLFENEWGRDVGRRGSSRWSFRGSWRAVSSRSRPRGADARAAIGPLSRRGW